MVSECSKREMILHAEEEFPRESCGLVTEGRYVRIKNDHEDPLNAFKINVKDYVEYLDHGIDLIVHSHTDGSEYPGKTDMESQIETDVPYCIIPVKEYKSSLETVVEAGDLIFFGEGVPTPELLGRPFRHGVTDCYALVKDWYKVNMNLTLPEFPREWGWWGNGEDMYAEGFKVAGFRDLEPGEKPSPGDIFLAAIRSKGILNHAGVLLKRSKIIHHMCRGRGYDPTSLSCEDSATRWANSIFLQKWVRYAGN